MAAKDHCVPIVLNGCYGGFDLSPEARKMLKTRGVSDWGIIEFEDECNRTDPQLVQVVHELGDKANSSASKLKIEYLPSADYLKIPGAFTIHEYDGMESLELFPSRLTLFRLANLDETVPDFMEQFLSLKAEAKKCFEKC